MSETKTTVNYNPGWLGLLGVIFVLCKIFEVGVIATWSWWLVLLPFYFGLAFLLAVLAVLAFGAVGITGFAGLEMLVDKYQTRKKRIKLEKEKVWKKLQGK